MNAFGRDPGLVLADRWQHGFPICARPFAAAGAAQDLSEIETLTTFGRLIANGLVSRIGAVVRPNCAGASTLAAMTVPPQHLNSIAAMVSAQPYVNHNYERTHKINLWFVVAAPDASLLAETLRQIEEKAGLAVLDLRLIESFHIDLGFGLASGDRAMRGARQPERAAREREKALLAAIQNGLPLVAEPYAAVARRLGWNEGEVMGCLAELIEAGILTRFGCVLRHRELGFTANAMAVWDVDEAKVRHAGQRLAQDRSVTLCYRRNRALPSWPFNLFAMIHGRDEALVRARVDALAASSGLVSHQHAILFSTRCFLQRGARFAQASTELAA